MTWRPTSARPYAGGEHQSEDRERSGGGGGRAVQVDPMKPMVKPPGTERLKLKCDILLSTSAFKSNLRRYRAGSGESTSPRTTSGRSAANSPEPGSTGTSRPVSGRQGLTPVALLTDTLVHHGPVVLSIAYLIILTKMPQLHAQCSN